MKNKKLFFFGIDSATWDLIIPWVREGKLPGFEKFINEGFVFPLRSTTPPLTPIAWNSLYTGTNPGKHGVFGFYKLKKDKQTTINLSIDRKLPTIFNILSGAGKKVAVLNLPMTFPPEEIDGVMLSGFLTPNLDEDFIYPESLKDEFKNRFPSYAFTEGKRYGMDKESQNQYFKALKKSVMEKIKAFDYLEKNEDWDLFAINFMEVDHVQHWFFKEKEKMLAIYKLVDEYLLRKISEKEYRHYLLFSDHGAGPYEKNINLNTYFINKGLLKLKKNWQTQLKYLLFRLGFTPGLVAKLALKFNLLPSSQSGRKSAKKMKFFLDINDIDWEKSVAFSFGYYGSVYLLKKDKATKQLVKDTLLEIEYKEKPVMDKVWFKEEIYDGKYISEAPDIVFSPKEYAFGASAVSPFLENKLFSTPHTLKSGEHRFDGIVGFYPKIKVKNTKRIDIEDLSAAILEYFDVSVPNYFDGQSFLETNNARGKSVVEEIEI